MLVIQNKLYGFGQEFFKKAQGREVKIQSVCVFRKQIAKGTSEVTETIQFILNGLMPIDRYSYIKSSMTF